MSERGERSAEENPAKKQQRRALQAHAINNRAAPSYTPELETNGRLFLPEPRQEIVRSVVNVRKEKKQKVARQ